MIQENFILDVQLFGEQCFFQSYMKEDAAINSAALI
jgi:hypothetical protein